MAVSNVVVDNVTLLPKSGAARAAASLVLQPHPYVPGNDVARALQAKFFQEPETQISAWKGSRIVIDESLYRVANDVQRIPQAKFFQEPEVYLQPQKGYLVTLSTYATVPQITSAPRSLVIENTSVIQPWLGSSVVINVSPGVVQSSDVFYSQDTQGWPIESFEPPVAIQPWRSSFVVINSFPSYVPGHDVQRATQAKFFPEVEFTIQPWRSNIVVLNRFAAYVPGTDVQRARNALYFQEPESFQRPAPFNELITNGSALVLVTMPNVVGLAQVAATTLLNSDGFLSVSISTALSSSVPFGVVISQSPIGGSIVPFGSPTSIVVSLGVVPILPGCVDLWSADGRLNWSADGFPGISADGYEPTPLECAVTYFSEVGVNVGQLTYQYSAYGVPVGWVITGYVPFINPIYAGQYIPLVISEGPAPPSTVLTVPNVVGKFYYDAQLALLQAGFGIDEPIWVLSSTVLPQYVISQSIPAGTTFTKQTIVRITVSGFTAIMQPGVPEAVP